MYNNQTNSETDKDFSLTFCQVISAFAVIVLHTNGCFWRFSGKEKYWFSANIIECVFYFAVPVFFMITGITLLDYQDRYSTKIYFFKRTTKVFIPYLFWSLIGIIYLIATGDMLFKDITAIWIINGLISTEGIVSFYWFFHLLFCVYLCIPLFASIEKKKKLFVAKYLLIIGFIANIIIPFLNNGFDLGLKWPYSISVISEYLIFVWGGYYLYNCPPTRDKKIIIHALAIAGLFMHIVGTYMLSLKFGEVQGQFKGYTNLPGVLYSFGAFILLRDISVLVKKVSWLYNLFNSLGKYVFAVYLLQWFIIRSIEKLAVFDDTSLVYRLILPFAIFVIIIVITWFLRKIPIIRKIIP